jgi:hypothetical protein
MNCKIERCERRRIKKEILTIYFLLLLLLILLPWVILRDDTEFERIKV